MSQNHKKCSLWCLKDKLEIWISVWENRVNFTHLTKPSEPNWEAHAKVSK